MKAYLGPFAMAMLVFGAVFLALDIAIMDLQGLSLFFQQ